MVDEIVNIGRVEGDETTVSGLVAGQDSVNIIKTPTMTTSNAPSPPGFGTYNGIPSHLETMSGSAAIPSPTRVASEPLPHDAPLPEGHTSRSVEGRVSLNELMVIFTTLTQRVTGLEQDLKKTKVLYGATNLLPR